jgi:hypothetical protein
VSPGRLAVIVDGAALPEEEARALWGRFSDHMDAHAGDLAGFARNEGFTSVHPEARSGVAVLVASRTEAQRPYGSPVAARSTGGSSADQRRRRHDRRHDRGNR